MAFHRSIQLPSSCTGWQIQLSIQGENLEVVAVHARGWTRSAVARFAEVVCAVYSFRRASFRNSDRLRRDVPSHPMREQSARRIWIIDDQHESFCFGKNARNLQSRTGVCAVARK